jgi:hypothetical protein
VLELQKCLGQGSRYQTSCSGSGINYTLRCQTLAGTKQKLVGIPEEDQGMIIESDVLLGFMQQTQTPEET